MQVSFRNAKNAPGFDPEALVDEIILRRTVRSMRRWRF